MRYNNIQDLEARAEELGYGVADGNSFRTRCAFIDEVLKDLYHQGYGIRAITRILPISYHAVREHLIAAGARIRARGGPNNTAAKKRDKARREGRL